MKKLSVFIDETGDFGAYDVNAPFYCVALVFHDQSIDISSKISALDSHMKYDMNLQSKSESDFFGTRKDFIKNIYKQIHSKRL